MTGPNDDGNFYAHKLAEVIVQVKDKADGNPLQVGLWETIVNSDFNPRVFCLFYVLIYSVILCDFLILGSFTISIRRGELSL